MPLEKRPFAKQTEVVDADELYRRYRAENAAPSIPAHKFEVWVNPSTRVFRTIGRTHQLLADGYFEDENTPEEEREAALREYWAALAEFVVDSDVEGLAFDTPEDVEANYDHPSVEYGYLNTVYRCLFLYVADGRFARKKGGSDPSKPSDSGEPVGAETR
jgi:hypothetical protein